MCVHNRTHQVMNEYYYTQCHLCSMYTVYPSLSFLLLSQLFAIILRRPRRRCWRTGSGREAKTSIPGLKSISQIYLQLHEKWSINRDGGWGGRMWGWIVHVNDDFCMRWQNNFTCEKYTHTHTYIRRETNTLRKVTYTSLCWEIKGNGRLYHMYKHIQPHILSLLLFRSFSCSLSCAVCSIILLPTFRAVPSNIIMLECIYIFYEHGEQQQPAC